MKTIKYEQFEQVEMRVGKIVKADNFPEARKPAYKLLIDFGELGLKNSSAQLTENYGPDDLLDRLIIAVTNFEPKRIAGFKSEVLVLGVLDDSEYVSLLAVEKDIPLGRVVF